MIGAYGYLLLLLPLALAGRMRATVATIIAGLVLTLLLAVDLTALRFFDTPFLRLYRYLPVSAAGASSDLLLGYVGSYIPLQVWLISAGVIALGLALARMPRDRSRARTVVLLLMAACFAGSTLSAMTSRPQDPRILSLVREPHQSMQQLSRSERPGAFVIANTARAKPPQTIILVIMESVGATTRSSDGRATLSKAIIRDSRATGWVDYRNAVTVSNATDISVPTILTGAGAHEPRAKIQTMPFLSQIAAARGYRTAFVTSSTMRWAGFQEFLAPARFDRVVSAEDAGLPFINDVAVDDHLAYRAAADLIGASDQKLFLTLYPQAMHWPIQTSSAFPIPDHIKDHAARAAHIAEAGFGVLFDALRQAGRLDDALIIVTGDHGDLDYVPGLRTFRMRLDTFDGGVLSPIFFIKVPAGLPPTASAALAANAGNLVATTDIAPTIADLLDARLVAGLSYSGLSLMRDMPAGRAVFSTSTNEWRDWPRAAVAVSQGRTRMTCNSQDLCRLSEARGPLLEYRRPATPDDALFQLASRDPVLRRALGQIYRAASH